MTSKQRYEAQRDASLSPQFRITDTSTDSRIATCYLEENAELICRALNAMSAPETNSAHADDLAVDRFAAAMKAKLAKKRAEGRGGWDDPERCTVEYLAKLLIEHLPKGDTVDIGNFAMMLWNRLSGDRAPLATVETDSRRDPELQDAIEALLWKLADHKPCPTCATGTSHHPPGCELRRVHNILNSRVPRSAGKASGDRPCTVAGCDQQRAPGDTYLCGPHRANVEAHGSFDANGTPV